eukprot:CAMPEP_0115863440 /NCGR_PEP_ID=MMETSP0287-20121206/18690_1 /TAXON_ID=412157 /ORGANISM="Chrysochromulina rotalis, Strain UIO044" /LENGTH=396 /DNA_ID=CAMNT_0003317887 /DNA_START=132 /DNA_END=1322 /DNA_ORIENTATION=+
MPVSETAKIELREEVEFTLLRLNAASRHVRHGLHMYTRDAAACLRAGDESVARQMIGQKLLMEQRADQINIQVSLLESVVSSLHPGLQRCRGDLITCRAIVDKCAASCTAPEVLTFMDVAKQPELDDEEGISPQAVELELRRVLDAIQQPFTSTTADEPYALQGSASSMHAAGPVDGSAREQMACDPFGVGHLVIDSPTTGGRCGVHGSFGGGSSNGSGSAGWPDDRHDLGVLGLSPVEVASLSPRTVERVAGSLASLPPDLAAGPHTMGSTPMLPDTRALIHESRLPWVAEHTARPPVDATAEVVIDDWIALAEGDETVAAVQDMSREASSNQLDADFADALESLEGSPEDAAPCIADLAAVDLSGQPDTMPPPTTPSLPVPPPMPTARQLFKED